MELLIAALIAVRPWWPRVSEAGSLAAVGMFLTTLSFLATTPGAWAHVDGFVVPGEAGAFLIKDVFLLGAALWTASEALAATAAFWKQSDGDGGENSPAAGGKFVRHPREA